MLRPATEHFPLIANWILRQNKKTGAMPAHRARSFFTSLLLYLVTSYFFGRDSGGTNPDTR